MSEPRTINAYAALTPKAKLTPYTFEAPPLDADGIEVQIQYCAICGSDVHLINSDGGYADFTSWSNGGKPDTDPAIPEAGAGSEIKHDCVCEPPNSGREQACWKASYPTKNVAFRCIPCANPDAADCQVKTSYTTKCQGKGVTCNSGIDSDTFERKGTGNYDG